MPSPCIMVAEDFSEHSAAAREHAISIARQWQAEIVLVHAYGAPAAAVGAYGSVLPVDLLDELRAKADERIGPLAERVSDAGVPVRTQLSRHKPQDALPHLAVGADLVVMGTRGLGGIQQVLLGSVAQHVVRAAPCPVMCVPGGSAPGERGYERILLPTDLATAAEAAVDMARRLAGRGETGAEIVLAHAVYVGHDAQRHLGGSAEPERIEIPHPIADELESLAEKLRAEGYRARAELLPDRPEIAIVLHAETMGADLIVMGTHGRRGLSQWLLGSVAERVLRDASCPTLTVKPPAD